MSVQKQMRNIRKITKMTKMKNMIKIQARITKVIFMMTEMKERTQKNIEGNPKHY